MPSMTEPTDTVAPATSAKSNNHVDLPEQPGRLLVADDEHLVASGLTASLRELGFKVLGPAADGEEAIELARELRPDMALLDIRMPRKNGLEAAEVLYRRMGVPVIIFSAYSDPEYIDTSNAIGVFGYLLKPVTDDQLRAGITIAWGRYIDDVVHRSEVGTLKQRLEDRKIVEQAKWIIVKRKGVDEPDAMRLLQRQARNNRRQLADVARSIIENEDLFGAK
ncbi:MAG: ANTAR domain-containing response regulator [Planctomycetota bacterium]|jgi:response regulator NasT